MGYNGIDTIQANMASMRPLRFFTAICPIAEVFTLQPLPHFYASRPRIHLDGRNTLTTLQEHLYSVESLDHSPVLFRFEGVDLSLAQDRKMGEAIITHSWTPWRESELVLKVNGTAS